jgi:hypothetical protein
MTGDLFRRAQSLLEDCEVSGDSDCTAAVLVRDMRDELNGLRETNKRLNRRCQLAEAAANLRAEDWYKRSTEQGRQYLWNLCEHHGDKFISLVQQLESTVEVKLSPRRRDPAE